MTRRCKCGCRAEIRPVKKCESYREARGFASEECEIKMGLAALEKGRAKKARKQVADIRKQKKEVSAKIKADKERIKRRTGKKGYYENLATELHYYVKHELRKGEPCYTCNKPQRFEDSPKSFHVGHFIPAGSVDPRRFMLDNLRLQCYSCNTARSGMRAEYRMNLVNEMGLAHVEWLECDANHKTLKEQYPDAADIKAETARYRKLNKPIRDGS